MTSPDEDELRRMLRVLDTPSESFAELAQIGGVNPATAFRGSDLREIDFGHDDLTGFSFACANLCGADLSRTAGLTAGALAGSRMDAATKGPRGMAGFPPRIPLVVWRDRIPLLPEDTCPEMVTLPSGRFTMGAPKSERDSDDVERPQREVTVPLFALGRYAVTFAQWDAARTDGAPLPEADHAGWGREDRPVINVSWHDAQTYCDWLNRRLGLQSGLYRLPSEAEWEYACRAGTTTPFSFGAMISTDQANYDGNFTYGRGREGLYREKTVPVGSLPANHWGLHEMHGNVYEWCEDAFGPYPARATGATPLQHKDEQWRVLRGGSWYCVPRYLRSANRHWVAPGLRNDVVGFRVARTPGS